MAFERYKMTVITSTGEEVPLSGVRRIVRTESGFTFVALSYGPGREMTVTQAGLYFDNRRISVDNLSRPTTLLVGDSVSISLVIRTNGWFTTAEELMESCLKEFNDIGRAAWKDVFECLSR